ncbi:MAG TPA: sigma-70 family RNA polymerase sigma factor, partial [Mycobacteriales bacterium]|nr:sigma-70 family RNA polymerase sigma factor [Mycobacteriales bacterium]
AGTRRLPPGPSPDDVVSETMTRAMVAVGRYDARDGSPAGWLFGIARNVVAEQRRRAERDATPPTTRTDSEPGPLQQLLDAERDAALRTAFDRLTDSDRELLELRVVGGLSTADLAVALGRREGAVRMAQSRALARLRRHFGEVSGA